jgi:hypothetical protein
MSGGSYNYLCFKDATDIGGQGEDLLKMVDRLNELGYPEISKDTEEIAKFFLLLNEKIDKLRDVWQAVEWMDSGDWKPEQFENEATKYLNNS